MSLKRFETHQSLGSKVLINEGSVALKPISLLKLLYRARQRTVNTTVRYVELRILGLLCQQAFAVC